VSVAVSQRRSWSWLGWLLVILVRVILGGILYSRRRLDQ